MGIGVQDLAGAFAIMDMCWDSEEARIFNEKFARVMYYHGMSENVEQAKKHGHYEMFPGSPASQGLFQFDLWTLDENRKKGCKTIKHRPLPCQELPWDDLRNDMCKYGLRFSLLFAQMPTASTAQILGSNESTECYSQLLFSRSVLSGQFVLFNKYLVVDLEKINAWNESMLKHLLSNGGSIQEFPDDNIAEEFKERFNYIKRKYKTSYEHKQKLFADMYLARARYQCQSSSNNLTMKNPTSSKLNAYHFYMWKGGAKTGMYYLKQEQKVEAINFALGSVIMTTRKNKRNETEVREEIECLMCQS